ncbi:NAD-dependent epimerase/dehydratase family protein [Lyngbya confervoides]|uniref:NAD-dependent epimerase/dehydratase family protein n=1 Tax=Lyngbya confervoides BDU141951 TaxID=1574623 RepID=A0ABD4SZK4_9CYAN|nr:NAD-dependent epimerase/dehydratase family protein [Lyngbya confervoides]MCM1981819.1 NAD-dependent epimerase/dehydratase family protein [Lyngbya confervoides BDU141951]
MDTIVITGVQGQIGTELVQALRKQFPSSFLIGIGRSALRPQSMCMDRYFRLDIGDRRGLKALAERYSIQTLYHLAGILSAKGEGHPHQCWSINLEGLRNILELARELAIKVFWPSSIAVFGPHTPKELTPQWTITDPTTFYGVTKLTGELLCQYYNHRWSLDVRSLRFPGILSYQTLPGGGTTDFAVEMHLAAQAQRRYTCFVEPDTCLPLMYMPDAIRAIQEIMDAPATALRVNTSYNLAGFSATAAEIAQAIQQHRPNFTCNYAPDFRQIIANNWPHSIDDTAAQVDWGWQPRFDLQRTTADMLSHLTWRTDHVGTGSF